jgi:hypothetical protein
MKFLEDSCGVDTYEEYLEGRLQSVLSRLEKYEMGYFVCPDCEYKVSPSEFLTGGKQYD